MQFHVPQFIDIEDKLFGPFTFKQGIYVAGGLGASFVIYRLVPYLIFSAPLIAGVGILTWALAFYPKEKLGKPFIEILEAGLKYTLKEKLYTWKKTTKDPKLGKEKEFVSAQVPVMPSVPSGALASYSLKLERGRPQVGNTSDNKTTL
ncbi:MAG: PrgI family protein [Candidatus Pacebacteria bacterium]|nr:PrgI family protein [Candidatus Paceibacterota bacterium]